MNHFLEISIVVFIATVLSLIMKLLRQPLVVGYIVSGIIAGPLVLDIIDSRETLELFSKIGITILLFIIGLHMNPKVIREVGSVALITGLGQIIVTTLIGIAIAVLVGYTTVIAFLIAIALTFSSTIVVLKLLADRNELYSLHGKVATAFLLVQDIVASVILLILAVLSQESTLSFAESMGLSLLRGIGLIALLWAISKYLLPKIVKFAASNQETLFVFCLSWGLGVAALFQAVGLSIEIGALVAGVALSVTSYAPEIASRLKPLRDFFIVLFFILLGSQMIVEELPNLLVPALIFSLYVLIGNPIIMFVLMNLLGYHNRTSFFTGLTVAQISEFSLILIALAKDSGYVDTHTASLVTLVGLITIAASSYMILHANTLYRWISPWLSLISVRRTRSKHPHLEVSYEALLFGHGRVGKGYLKVFKKLNLHSLAVDFDPTVISYLESKGYPCIYGDANDVEFVNDLSLDQVKIVVSAIADFETDLLLVREIRKVNSKAVVIVKTSDIEQALQLYAAGASYVIMPHYLGAAYAQRLIKTKGFQAKAYDDSREKHLLYLRRRVV